MLPESSMQTRMWHRPSWEKQDQNNASAGKFPRKTRNTQSFWKWEDVSSAGMFMWNLGDALEKELCLLQKHKHHKVTTLPLPCNAFLKNKSTSNHWRWKQRLFPGRPENITWLLKAHGIWLGVLSSSGQAKSGRNVSPLSPVSAMAVSELPSGTVAVVSSDCFLLTIPKSSYPSGKEIAPIITVLHDRIARSW